MNFYKECFGGGELTIQTVGESPMAKEIEQLWVTMYLFQLMLTMLSKERISSQPFLKEDLSLCPTKKHFGEHSLAS
jgi:hypothetical protein